MLTPKQLQEIIETLQPTLDDLNSWITKDIIERVMARLGRGEDLELTPTDQWQAQVLIDVGGHLEDLQREIALFTKAADVEVRKIFQSAGLKAYEADARIIRNAGAAVPPIRQSPRIQQILSDTYQRTSGELQNITRTTAMATQTRLIKALDLAHMKVMSGATSYSEAVRQTVNDLAQYQACVQYPTGHVDTLEVAVLRAVRTGTAQASGNMTIETMNQYDWDIVLTSAHMGARYGDGGQNPSNHEWWQGRFFSKSGKNKEYPDFLACTGYGTGEGLCGWNCRHSFGPGDGHHNPWRKPATEDNRRAYDLSQEQRLQERTIRKQKRIVMAYKTALDNCQDVETRNTLQATYNTQFNRLRSMNGAYNEFCEENDLKKFSDRLQIAEWDYREAMKAYHP